MSKGSPWGVPVRSACVLFVVVLGCSGHGPPPSRAPRHAASAPTARPPPVEVAPPKPVDCSYDDPYDDTSLDVALEPDEQQGSRFENHERGPCGDAELVLDESARGSTLTVKRAGKSAVLFRDVPDFVLLDGCVDLTGDGVPELVVRRSTTHDTASTEVFSLESPARSLFKVPFELELKKTRKGPFPYELVNDDWQVMTYPRLPVVFAYRDGRFQRVGGKDRDYWAARREPVKQTLSCLGSESSLRAFTNRWFSTSLYVGDWEKERAAFALDATRAVELALARPTLVSGLDLDTAIPDEPPDVWLASKDSPPEVRRALDELSKLPTPPATTEIEPVEADPNASLPAGFRFLDRPKNAGALAQRCGSYVVEQVNGAPISSHVRLRGADGRYAGVFMPALDIGSSYAEWCFDLTGDGFPELLVTESSGGAHCCQTFRVISLGPSPELLLEFFAGNAWLEGTENLDGTGAYELIARDDFLTNGASSSAYAGTYFVPVVFVLENGKYVRHTRRFKPFLKKERDELVADYRDEDASGLTSDPSGWMALSLLIGDWDQVKRKLPIEPSSRTWFDPQGTLAKIQRDIER
ncbi:MAG TPA: hypothetical protein VF103_16435 [Polyangiaceae bacterium]